MNCDDVRDKLSGYDEGLLDRGISRRIQTHLQECTRCREELEALSRTQRAVKNLPEIEVPPGFTGRVMARVREEKQPSGFWLRNYPAIKVMITVNAVALLVVGFLTVLLQRGEQSQDQLEIAQSFSEEAERETDEIAMPDRAPESPPVPSAPIRSLEEKPQGPDEVGRSNTLEKKQRARLDEGSLPEPLSTAKRDDDSKEERTNQKTEKIIGFLASPDPMADFEIYFQPETRKDQNGSFNKRLDALLKEVGGKRIPQMSEDLKNDTENSISGRTVWLLIPEPQFKQFKINLASHGEIQSEMGPTKPSAPSAFRKALPSEPEGGFHPTLENFPAPFPNGPESLTPSLQIKLNIQPSK